MGPTTHWSLGMEKGEIKGAAQPFWPVSIPRIVTDALMH